MKTRVMALCARFPLRSGLGLLGQGMRRQRLCGRTTGLKRIIHGSMIAGKDKGKHDHTGEESKTLAWTEHEKKIYRDKVRNKFGEGGKGKGGKKR